MVEKTIMIKKRGGGKRPQRVKVLASGKYKFIKNKSTRKTKKRKPKRSRKVKRKANKRGNPKTRRIRTMPRRNKKKHSNNNNLTGKVMKYTRLGALVAPALGHILEPTDPQRKVSDIIYDYTGYNMADGSFQFGRLAKGWAPYLGAVVVTKGIQKLSGIIRKL